MSVPDVKVGDDVEISVRGKVVSLTPPSSYRSGGKGRMVVERADGKRGIYFYGGQDGQTEVKVLPPSYVDGGVYLDADSELLKFDAGAGDGLGGWHEFNKNGTDADRWYPNTLHRGYPRSPVMRVA